MNHECANFFLEAITKKTCGWGIDIFLKINNRIFLWREATMISPFKHPAHFNPNSNDYDFTKFIFDHTCEQYLAGQFSRTFFVFFEASLFPCSTAGEGLVVCRPKTRGFSKLRGNPESGGWETPLGLANFTASWWIFWRTCFIFPTMLPTLCRTQCKMFRADSPLVSAEPADSVWRCQVNCKIAGSST